MDGGYGAEIAGRRGDGHAVGDAVLQAFAGSASATLGSDVLFARIGGEEFASCLPVGDLDEAYAIADRIRRKFVAAAAHFGSDDLMPSVSAGVTLSCDSRATVTDLLSIVDRALYRAKELGRNRVETDVQDGDAPVAGAPSIVPIIEQTRTAAAPNPSSAAGVPRHGAVIRLLSVGRRPVVVADFQLYKY